MKVMEAMVFTMDARKVGEVYLRLAKYIFRVKLTLNSRPNSNIRTLVKPIMRCYSIILTSLNYCKKKKKLTQVVKAQRSQRIKPRLISGDFSFKKNGTSLGKT
ncbi:hypothetical protein AMTRI_Chr07g80310 [Amborella trichopoda]